MCHPNAYYKVATQPKYIKEDTYTINLALAIPCLTQVFHIPVPILLLSINLEISHSHSPI